MNWAVTAQLLLRLVGSTPGFVDIAGADGPLFDGSTILWTSSSLTSQLLLTNIVTERDFTDEWGGDGATPSPIAVGVAIAPTAVDVGDTPAATAIDESCLLYTSPSPRDQRGSRMPSSA